MMRTKHVTGAAALALLLLALAFLQLWILIAVGLLALGVAGYLPSISRVNPTPRTSRALLMLFIIFSLGQIVLQCTQEKDARRTSKLLNAALTNTQAFLFRIVVEPDRTPHFMLNVIDPMFRPFYSSRGPALYTQFMNLGGGDTQQAESERPNIAPLSATFILNNPPVEPLTPAFAFENVDDLVLDVAEMTVIHWLLTVGASAVEADAGTALSAENSDFPTIRSIHHAFNHNRFIEYLADTAGNRSFTRHAVAYPKTGALLGQFLSETAPQDVNKKRVIAVVGPSYRVRIVLQHEGQTRLKPREARDLGILLMYNDVELPFVMTEDFRITVTVRRDEAFLQSDMSINEIVSLMRRDFDWSIYKDTLLLTRDR